MCAALRAGRRPGRGAAGRGTPVNEAAGAREVGRGKRPAHNGPDARASGARKGRPWGRPAHEKAGRGGDRRTPESDAGGYRRRTEPDAGGYRRRTEPDAGLPAEESVRVGRTLAGSIIGSTATAGRRGRWVPQSGRQGSDRHRQGDRGGHGPTGPADRVSRTLIAAPDAAEGATMAKATDTRSASTTKAAAKRTRSAAETEKIRQALVERRDELQTEYDQSLSEITELQRERLAHSAGDDQADTGTKTFEREQEITLANNLLERITQVERAIDRLGEGHYGWCERCGNPIPVERLAAFPSATLCVSCKQLEERR